MNQPEEDQSPDEEISTPLTVVEKPKSEFTRPSYSFKGVELWPYEFRYDLICNQISDKEDTGLYTWQAFIFLLSKRSKTETAEDHAKWASSIAWKVEDFRFQLGSWTNEIGGFSMRDKIEAKRIYEESMQVIRDAAVEPVPVRGRAAQKKTCRKKTQLSSISSATS